MAKKQPKSSSNKAIIVVVCVIGGIALAVIVAAIIIMFFIGGAFIGTGPYDTNTKSSTGTNTIAQNNAIQAQAITQKDPSLCDQIRGETSVTMPLPGGNKVQTFDEATSKQRCKTQAEAGQPFVY